MTCLGLAFETQRGSQKFFEDFQHNLTVQKNFTEESSEELKNNKFFKKMTPPKKNKDEGWGLKSFKPLGHFCPNFLDVLLDHAKPMKKFRILRQASIGLHT